MKRAADFRKIARDALRGRWSVAVLTGFIASLMGAGIGSGSISLTNNTNYLREIQLNELSIQLQTLLIVSTVVILIWAIITVIIGGAGKLGYAVFNLKLVDNKKVSLTDLFSQFHRFGEGFCMNFFAGLFIFLWTLLFVIPGLIKIYSYAMAPYILAENPGMTAMEAIKKSRHVMDGNKWRLFCLDLSFIGWWLLCILPSFIMIAVLTGSGIRENDIGMLLGLIPCIVPYFVGSLFLNPYLEAAYAAFYRDVR